MALVTIAFPPNLSFCCTWKPACCNTSEYMAPRSCASVSSLLPTMIVTLELLEPPPAPVEAPPQPVRTTSRTDSRKNNDLTLGLCKEDNIVLLSPLWVYP